MEFQERLESGGWDNVANLPMNCWDFLNKMLLSLELNGSIYHYRKEKIKAHIYLVLFEIVIMKLYRTLDENGIQVCLKWNKGEKTEQIRRRKTGTRRNQGDQAFVIATTCPKVVKMS